VRGQLAATKQPDGTWLVSRQAIKTPLAGRRRPRPTRPNQPNQTDTSPDASIQPLLAQLRQENARLWTALAAEREHQAERERRHAQELERRAEELRRKDLLLAEMTRRLPALPETCPDPPAHPWWRFWRWRWR